MPVPQGNVGTTSREARQVAEELIEGPFVIKAQILAGGFLRPDTGSPPNKWHGLSAGAG